MSKTERQLAEIVERRGNREEVNFARELLGKRPISLGAWIAKDIEGQGG